jgi:two-component system phosphate regulon sensor histidine kinase PhoR
MKKVFPAIVLLTTLSVLGILFIQMQWIRNAIVLKREQYIRDIDLSLADVRQQAHKEFLERRQLTTAPSALKEFALQTVFTSQIYNSEEMRQVVDRSLKQNNIRQPFEYCVTDFLGNPVLTTPGFRSEYFPHAHNIVLTPPESMLSEVLHIYIHEPRNYIISQMGWMIVASVVFTSIIFSAFWLTIRTMFRQKKLSEVKSDFINNMTHEFKTPLATISLAADALGNEKVIRDEQKIRYYSGIIKDENRRMNKQVERILQAARIERQDVKLHLQELDAHEAIRKVAENFALQIEESSGELKLNLNAPRYRIKADEVHFNNIIFNLLDNAIKYADGNPRIEVETLQSGQMLAIRVRDNGIGMNKETQSRIFEKFYRAHTGNLHNVKGFGLGLSYVKTMVDAHNGKIKVESTVGKGSTFTILLPLA